MGIDMDKEIIEGLEIVGDRVAEEAVKAEKKIEASVVSGYKAIEETVVDGYRKIEETVVGGFNRMADGFVGKFLAKDGENVGDARARVLRETAERQEAIQRKIENRNPSK